MKKNKLAAVYQFDFELIGIVSASKEYKLAWHLNQLNFFHLKKEDDIRIEFEANKQIRISNLMDEAEYFSVHLLKNKLVTGNAGPQQLLLPELQQFDYLLKLKNLAEETWIDRVLDQLKNVPVVEYAVKIDINKLKLKENLLF